MLINNYENYALLELEKQRTNNYGNDIPEYDNYTNSICCKCGKTQNVLDINSCFVCSDCILEMLREEFSQLDDDKNIYNINLSLILNDIISDFSDSELLSYIENRYIP